MIYFEDWIDNYIDILNITYYELLTISINKGINIIDNQKTFDDYCYMVYVNSRNYKLFDPNDFEYIN
tara:strand:+ start:923 stop:1123 length:201 start_codon:yes stop_codon:yes gene_type:complete